MEISSRPLVKLHVALEGFNRMIIAIDRFYFLCFFGKSIEEDSLNDNTLFTALVVI